MLECRSISVSYGDVPALRDLDLTVVDGSITALIGPSGCGKTTLLRVIAGLEQPDAGSISWNGTRLDDVPTHRRGFGLMFQDFALFPHRTVAENVAFGLRMREEPEAVIEDRVTEVLGFVGLAGYGSRQVTELSGGEQQRVALARTLAPRPRLVMLDEPLGSLDRGLSDRLVVEMRDLFRRLGVTVLYVTHDQDEAFTVGDSLVVMREGQIVVTGAAEDVWRHPQTEWVARFIGHENILPSGSTLADVLIDVDRAGAGAFAVPAAAVKLDRDPAGRGVVREVTFKGGLHRIEVDVAGHTIVASSPSPLPVGAQVAVAVAATDVITLEG